jgi:hypothetical protein
VNGIGVPQEIEDAIVTLAIEQPAFGQVRVRSHLRLQPKSGFAPDPPVAATAPKTKSTLQNNLINMRLRL